MERTCEKSTQTYLLHRDNKYPVSWEGRCFRSKTDGSSERAPVDDITDKKLTNGNSRIGVVLQALKP